MPDIDRNPCGEIKLPDGPGSEDKPAPKKRAEADRMMDFFGGKSEW